MATLKSIDQYFDVMQYHNSSTMTELRAFTQQPNLSIDPATGDLLLNRNCPEGDYLDVPMGYYVLKSADGQCFYASEEAISEKYLVVGTKE